MPPHDAGRASGEASLITASLHAPHFHEVHCIWKPAITDSGAKDFISGLYNKYDSGYHFDLLGMLVCVVCLVFGAICFKVETFSKTLDKSRDDGTSGTAAPQTQDVPPKMSV